MLTKVELINFQAHEHLELELGRMTCLTGPSNSGKSAVIRALAGLLRNDSAGPFVRHGADNLQVNLHRDDGYIVSWKKGKESPSYSITDPQGEVTTLKKVGASVPEEVSDLLRMGPVVLEDGSKRHLNLNTQAEPPFLVFDTGPAVAKVMGELTSAGKLFSAANEGNRQIREDKKLLNVRREDVSTLRDELQQYSDVDAQLESVQQAADLVLKAEDAWETREKIEQALALREETYKQVADASARLEYLKVEVDLDTLEKTLKAGNLMEAAVREYQDLTHSLEKLQVREEALEKVSLDRVPGLEKIMKAHEALNALLSNYQEAREGVISAQARYEILNKLDIPVEEAAKTARGYSALKELAEEHASLQDQKEALECDLKGISERSEEVWALIREVDVCPTCEQKITERAKEALTNG